MAAIAPHTEIHSRVKRKNDASTRSDSRKKLKSEVLSHGEVVRIGEHKFVWGENLSEMEDSTDDFLNDRLDVLKDRMETEGFLFVRGVINKKTCQDARSRVLDYAKEAKIIKKKNFRKAPIGKGNVGYAVDALTGGAAAGVPNDADAWRELNTSPELTNIYNGKDVNKFLTKLFGELQMLPEQTWVRLIHKTGRTVAHADYYYFRKDTQVLEESPVTEKDGGKPKFVLRAKINSKNCEKCTKEVKTGYRHCSLCGGKYHVRCMTGAVRTLAKKPDMWSKGVWHCASCADGPLHVYTIWICLSDLEPKDSVLAVCPKTQTLRGFNLPKRNAQLPRDYKKQPWVVPSKIHPGDIIVFNIKTVHSSTENLTNFYRLSVDTRFHLKTPGSLQISYAGK